MDREKEEKLIEAIEEVGKICEEGQKNSVEGQKNVGRKVGLGWEGKVDRAIGGTVGGILEWQ